MKKLCFIFCILLSIQLNAQRTTNGLLDVLKKDAKILSYEIDSIRKSPSSILFDSRNSYRVDNIQSLMQTYFGFNANHDEIKLSTHTDLNDQISVERYHQYYKGVKVEFGSIAVTQKEGIIESMSAEYYPTNESIVILSVISESQALTKALDFIHAQKYAWEDNSQSDLDFGKYPVAEKVLVSSLKSAELKLAYKFDIYSLEPLSRDNVYVDAITGRIILRSPTLMHTYVSGSATTKYSGTRSISTDQVSATSFRLHGIQSGLAPNALSETYNMNNVVQQFPYTAATEITNTSNIWNNTAPNSNGGNGGLDAHWGAQITLEYWKNIHARNSYNNAGAAVKSYVHFGNSYDNAFWNGSVMTYGDGSWNGSNGNFSALTSLDVCGHEIGHAVCSSTANLIYNNESGALNEAFSDIWAACIENYSNVTYGTTKQVWLIGEQIEHRPGYVSLRNMSNPNVNYNPDTYGGNYWYVGTGDYGGVHTNSGVLNKFFYILTMGESGTNDNGNAYAVTGIGFTKSQKIAYLAELNMTSSSNYLAARTAFINAAITLYGSSSLEKTATENAWCAVGVGGSLCPSCPSNIIISGLYSPVLTSSSTWIKNASTATTTTTINPNSVVKLDADPQLGYVELNPGLYASPNSAGMFIAQALDGCGSQVPTITVINTMGFDLSLFIQGYYSGNNTMQPVLMNQGIGNDPSLVDSIIVELHDPISPATIVSSNSVLLRTDGNTTANFPVVNGSYYIVIKHRNGLETWSRDPVTMGPSFATNYYDFRDASNKAYGNNMIEVEPGVWAIYSGDLQGDQNTDLLDLVAVESDIDNFLFGYLGTDINGDGNVDLLDTPIVENNINNFIFSAHP